MHLLLRHLQRQANVIGRGLAGYNRVLTLDKVNPRIEATSYSVRGEIYLAAVKRTQDGKEVIYCNIGNPHSLGQPPVTFTRQVLALLMAPFLMETPSTAAAFPSDAIARAKSYLASIKGGMGAYSDSKGDAHVRQEIADFITKKSGQPSSIDNIFISNGASEVARLLLFALIRSPSDGILVPVPQYPLYSASISLYGGQLVPYYLDEEEGWGLRRAELERSLAEATAKGVTVKAMVLINPGNPTGQSLSAETLKEVLTFCHAHSILVMADEVYQENIYNPQLPFVSARRVLGEMAPTVASSLELISMHSTSKGMTGECGLRGGYAECHNVLPALVDELYKLSAINLCSNLPGQVALGLMVNPPRPGDPSYALYLKETTDLHSSLQRRAARITAGLNAIPGVSCQPTEGALYAFPQIHLPPKFIAHAASERKDPDTLYCLLLLEATGLCCVPGTGFRQKPGTLHFRITILPQEGRFDDIISRIASFHGALMARWQ